MLLKLNRRPAWRGAGPAVRRGVRMILPAAVGLGPRYAGGGAHDRGGRRGPRSYLYVHAEAIVVDGRRAFVGTENLVTASLDHNRQLGVIVADPSAVQRLESTCDGDWAQVS
jgi:phosphatidylserine/phosphatidylglycerophosphate/cardiolipin synthase-like enzyme